LKRNQEGINPLVKLFSSKNIKIKPLKVYIKKQKQKINQNKILKKLKIAKDKKTKLTVKKNSKDGRFSLK